jgi:hypothetical protein
MAFLISSIIVPPLVTVTQVSHDASWFWIASATPIAKKIRRCEFILAPPYLHSEYSGLGLTKRNFRIEVSVPYCVMARWRNSFAFHPSYERWCLQNEDVEELALITISTNNPASDTCSATSTWLGADSEDTECRVFGWCETTA